MVTAPALLPRQASFDELGEPLRDVTFVVVDLETTGGSAHDCEITEVGAVKVRAGEVLAEMQTLVNPQRGIPPFIAVLTGITDAMVAGAPSLSEVVPTFLEFARGSVLVAHNAPFDLGFLRAACERTGHPWPRFESVDTARLARRVLTRDESPDCRLATLARLFRSRTAPCHRALADARATVDVLHGLLERLGNLGIQSMDELRTFCAQVPAEQRRKRHLADGLPHAPGVYLFRDAQGRVLYVGKSRDLRARVRTYFTASEPRTRMAEMVAAADRVDAVPCATSLEAEVRELRLIAEHDPHYNRRSRRPHSAVHVKLTDEPFPRLSIVRSVRADALGYLGPFASSRQAELAIAAVHQAVPLRQCTARLSPRRPTPSCVLADIGRCGAPCTGRQSVADYGEHAATVQAAMAVDAGAIVDVIAQRVEELSAAQRFEDAAAARNRLAAFLRTAARTQERAALVAVDELVAARPTADGGWELHVLRAGRLVAAGIAPRGADPRPYVDALRASQETVLDLPDPSTVTTAEEVDRVLAWLRHEGVRLVHCTQPWSSPARGAARHRQWLSSPDSVVPFPDQRPAGRPAHRPARGFGG